MIFHSAKKVLILAPHPDDAEFGLGATIARMHAQGKEIHVAVFSLCEKSTPEGFAIGVIATEMMASLQFLGIKEENIHVRDFPVREFPANRQQILEWMLDLKNQLAPDLVFTPSSSDIHQDHQTIYAESLRAFKNGNLLGYEMPWNNFGFTSYVYVCVSEEELSKKIAALNHYTSQQSRSYIDPDFVTSLCRVRGGQIQKQYAESFQLIRLIQV